MFYDILATLPLLSPGVQRQKRKLFRRLLDTPVHSDLKHFVFFNITVDSAEFKADLKVRFIFYCVSGLNGFLKIAMINFMKFFTREFLGSQITNLRLVFKNSNGVFHMPDRNFKKLMDFNVTCYSEVLWVANY